MKTGHINVTITADTRRMEMAFRHMAEAVRDSTIGLNCFLRALSHPQAWAELQEQKRRRAAQRWLEWCRLVGTPVRVTTGHDGVTWVVTR